MGDLDRIDKIVDKLILDLAASKYLLLDYIQLKIKEEDWHGAIDALMDIRDLDAQVKGIMMSNGKAGKKDGGDGMRRVASE